MNKKQLAPSRWRFATSKGHYSAIRYSLFAIRSRESGFTLVEMLVGIALVALLSIVLSAIIVTAQRSAADEKTRSDLTVENRHLVDDTSRDIKLATTVLASATLLGTAYTTGAETLILQLPAIDASQSLLTGVSDLVVFRKNGSDYEFIQDAGAGSVRPDTTGRIYSERMTGLTFTYYDGTGNVLTSNFQNALAISIGSTVSGTVRGQTITSTLTDTATLRNK